MVLFLKKDSSFGLNPVFVKQGNIGNVSDEFKSRSMFHQSRVSLVLVTASLCERCSGTNEVDSNLFFLFDFCCCFVIIISGSTTQAGAMSVDIEAAGNVFDQMCKIPWITERVKRFIHVIKFLFLEEQYIDYLTSVYFESTFLVVFPP